MPKSSLDYKEPYPADSTTIKCAAEERGVVKTLCSTVSNITVEPLVLLFIMPYVITSLSTQNLNLEKACSVNLKLNESVCEALKTRNVSAYSKTQEIEVQKMVALAYVWKSFIHSATPVLILIFIGSWSDRNRRRKACVLVPMVGELLTVSLLLLCVRFYYELPMEANIVAESLAIVVTGGSNVFLVGIFTVICNSSAEKSRTVRVGIIHILFQLGFTAGQALSGILLHNWGFYGAYTVSLSLYAAGVLYTVLFIKEEKYVPDERKRNVGFFRDFFNIQHVKKTFSVVFKQGDKLKMKKICVIIAIAMMAVGSMHGELSVLYLYTRFKFRWNEVDFSIFFFCCAIIHLAATAVILSILSKFVKVNDAMLGMIAAVSKMAGTLTYAFAPNGTIFYLGIGADILSGIMFISVRSMISKQVLPEELGKMNSVFGIAEAIIPLIYGPVYSATYRATITIFPGLFFVMSSVVTVPVVIMYAWLYANRTPVVEHKPEDFEKREKLLLK